MPGFYTWLLLLTSSFLLMWTLRGSGDDSSNCVSVIYIRDLYWVLGLMCWLPDGQTSTNYLGIWRNRMGSLTHPHYFPPSPSCITLHISNIFQEIILDFWVENNVYSELSVINTRNRSYYKNKSNENSWTEKNN